MANNCDYESEFDYHPPLWKVLDATAEGGSTALLSQFMNFFTLSNYSSLGERALWKYGERRMRIHAKINEDNEYPDPAWDRFMDNMNVIKQLYFPRIQSLMDSENENLSEWLASKREVTAKQYPAPNGDPDTAYVTGMQTQVESDNAHMSPDDMERMARYQSAFDSYLDQFGSLFLGVM